VSGRVRVLVWHRVPESERANVQAAHRQINEALRGTPGLLASELLGARSEPDSVVVMSEWESLAAFEAWESGTGHRGTTAPLRPYRDQQRERGFEVYQVIAESAATARV
jgi:heme-degrading monooxygenase HmoA